ncbi:MAG: hypothetical protein M3Y77_11415 [Actinomycetota bacterium]|nr:hypothetical protein [Actinomycetota bacterium]
MTMALVVLALVAVVFGAAGVCLVLHHRTQLRAAEHAATEHLRNMAQLARRKAAQPVISPSGASPALPRH